MYKRKTEEEKKQEMELLVKKLEDGYKNYISEDRYKELLHNLDRFHNYSVKNTMLIQMQKPDATLVGSYTLWNRMNRQVEKGEKGIAILSPVPYEVEKLVTKLDENKKPVLDAHGIEIQERRMIQQVNFKLSYVFDVSQTKQMEGKKEFALEYGKILTGDVKNFDTFKKAIVKYSKSPIEFDEIKNAAKGYYSLTEDKIVIKDDLSPSQTLKTMIHEIAHSILHSEHEEDTMIEYAVAECMEFPNYGEYHENLTLKEAIAIYKNIPDERLNAGKCIGVILHDDSLYADGFIPMVRADEVLENDINDIEYYRNNLSMQKAILDLKNYFEDNELLLKSSKEVQAESVSYIVSNHFGLDTSDYSFGYIASWAKDFDHLKENLEAIKTCSREIIQGVEKEFNALIREQHGIKNECELAKQIDSFMQKHDKDYQSHELYKGSHYDQIVSQLRKGNVEQLQNYFTDVLQNGVSENEANVVNQILECVETFQKEMPQKMFEALTCGIAERGIES